MVAEFKEELESRGFEVERRRSGAYLVKNETEECRVLTKGEPGVDNIEYYVTDQDKVFESLEDFIGFME